MLELRILSMTGSVSTLYYFLTRPKHQIVYGPIIWSMIFLSTNALMAYYVIEERQGKTRQFTNEEEDVYEEHFLPYGVTPRQYEKLLNIVQKVHLKRGEVLIQKDDSFDAVYLVTSGSTSAMTSLSRRVTAASSVKGNKDKLGGGDAGAWIGELAFLEKLGSHTTPVVSSSSSTISSSSGSSGSELLTNPLIQKHFSNPWAKVVNITIGKYSSAASCKSDDEKNDGDSSSSEAGNNKTIATAAVEKGDKKTKEADKQKVSSPSSQRQHHHNHEIHEQALLTYIANQDSVLYKWDFGELARLLSSSVELRLAVTRAMTAAVVHKVVNLYLSKSDAGNGSDTNIWKNLVDDMNDKTDQVVMEARRTNRKMQRLGTVRINVVEKDENETV